MTYICKTTCFYKGRLYEKGQIQDFADKPCQHFVNAEPIKKEPSRPPDVFDIEGAGTKRLLEYASEKGVDVSMFQSNSKADEVRQYLKEKLG